MLAEIVESISVVAELAAWDPNALLDGWRDRGEVTLLVAASKIVPVCRFLKERGFIRLSSITAVDWHPAEPRFEVVYHLHDLERNQRLRLKCRLAEGEAIESVTPVWRGANWYEREVWDLFGVPFANHPDLRRILLPEDWADHPLRKDYPVHGHRYDYSGEELG
ncbi:MAG: NADH-quinone oxidoreductase subunit C [Bryobacteraceae bacterium]